jgi:adenylate cyclase
VATQLIDATTGAHRWAEHYDRKLEQVFAVQDEVVRTIVAILAAHVRKAEAERTRAKAPNSWQAYDYYLKGAEAFASFQSSFSMETLYEARRLLQQSLALDGSYAECYVRLAHTHEVAWTNPVDSDFLNPKVLDEAHQLARKGIQLDPNLPEAHTILALVLTWQRQHEASLIEIERAIALNPNYVDWRFGLVLVLAGHSQRAVDVLESCMRLDPFHSPVASGALGFAHYMLKQYAQALPALRDCVSRSPNMRGAHLWLAATYARLGRMEEARAEVAEVLRIHPDYSIAATTRRIMGFKSAEDAEHFFDGLRKAGLPE